MRTVQEVVAVAKLSLRTNTAATMSEWIKTLSLSVQYTHIYSTSETMTIQPDMHANKTTVHDTKRQIRATPSMTKKQTQIVQSEYATDAISHFSKRLCERLYIKHVYHTLYMYTIHMYRTIHMYMYTIHYHHTESPYTVW